MRLLNSWAHGVRVSHTATLGRPPVNGVIEILLERYIRFPDTLDTEGCQEVERLLKSSAFAKAVAALHREFYVELDALEVRTGPLLEEFVRELFASGEGEP